MDWYVIHHPDTGGVGVVAGTALQVHRGQGWIRVSDAVDEGDKAHLDLSAYAEAPDLDVRDDQDQTEVRPEPAAEPAPSEPTDAPTGGRAAKSSREK